MTGACKDCPERHVGCHSNCERYAADVAERQKIKDARWKERFCEAQDIRRNMKRQANVRSISRRRQGY